MFDAIAGRYDLLNHLLSAGIDRRWRRRAIESLELTGTECVLDLCTGTGDLAIAARTRRGSPARRVIGIDFANAMLRVGVRKTRERGLDASVTLLQGDATAIPVADKTIDAATVAFGIRNVESVERACAEIRRVLKPEGRLAILEFGVPTATLIRAPYLWYFDRILPQIGRIVSRHNAAYGYLPASVRAFAAPDEFVKILRQSGFARVSASPLTFGIVYLYTAQ
jgi:demethylmenaquinone methyltransferase/2-methoxy-6-polyprenyl-1,4-benzoquinol methylase